MLPSHICTSFTSEGTPASLIRSDGTHLRRGPSLLITEHPTHTSCLTQKATQKVYFIIHVCRWWFNHSFYDRCLQPNAPGTSPAPQCRCFVLCTDFSFDSICCVQGHMTTVAGDRPTNQVINGRPRQLYSCSSSTSACSSYGCCCC